MYLKNEHIYFNKLLAYAELIKVKVMYKYDIEENSFFIPSRREIVLHIGDTGGELIATFLHELGHFEDDQEAVIIGKNNQGLTLSQKQKNRLYQMEVRAWKKGRILAQKLQIPLGQWYSKVEKECLKTYL